MILYREIRWWYWAVTSVLLIAGLAGRFETFYLATALSAIQVVHFRLSHGTFAAFSVQVRVAFTAMLLGRCGSRWTGCSGHSPLARRCRSVRLLHLGAHPFAYVMEPVRTPLGRFVMENFSLSAG